MTTQQLTNSNLQQQWIQPPIADSAGEIPAPTGNIGGASAGPYTSAYIPPEAASAEEVSAIATRLIKKNAELYRRLAK